jgi:hypothetical protein
MGFHIIDHGFLRSDESSSLRFEIDIPPSFDALAAAERTRRVLENKPVYYVGFEAGKFSVRVSSGVAFVAIALLPIGS